MPRLVFGTKRATVQSPPAGHWTHWTPPVLFTHMMVVVDPPPLAFIAWQSGPRALQRASAWSTLVAAAGVAMLAAIKAAAIVSISL